ncbi:lipopolysaccharide biosynthesis protein [Maribacter luteus]|uniref:lipopolysaccharide biosynthesis protein n=1 Tax=Maribacter luteus TaxID=2594478 RepID=UPI002493A0A7|nr:oligosaccharide flippase family protein [Maribacter luteus]
MGKAAGTIQVLHQKIGSVMVGKLKKLGKEKNLSSLLSNVSVAFAGLLSFMLLTRQLDKEAFGDWVLFITLSTFVDLLRFGLTRNASVRLLSGTTFTEKKQILGSSYRINLWLLIIIILVCWVLALVLNFLVIDVNNGYELFLIWYPILALANLGWNNALALFQAEQNFNRMMVVRLLNVGLFLVFLLLNHFWLGLGLMEIIWVNLFVNLVSSLWCTLRKWDGLLYLPNAVKPVEKELIHFGKYSMGTLVSSSLLKSADTFIIGLSPFLGSSGIAMYAIPLKLTDLLGIPLNSFTMTAYPRMSKSCLEGKMHEARKIFYTYTGIITLLFLPVAIFSFIMAEEMVLFLGGDNYADSLPLLTFIFRIFTVYVMLLPLDRFTGVLLDSLNRPKYNLYKVIVMTLANILIDIIAVFVFESLVLVAVGTVLFTLIGIFMGFYLLRKEIEIHSKDMITESFLFIKKLKTHLPV